ncbi:transglutaminaseTgpA domain-containing protein [Niallia sp. Krafla_26]|uniref:transglutaminaseTgpA domain-containing protein n=1 Tax=Niallia sp. Krafla_26 TaxID=3064703 RepID=UPI003D168340
MKKRMDLSFLLLNTIGFLLLLEWIWPLDTLSNTAEKWVFLVFLLVCYVLSFIRFPIILNVSIKSLMILILLYEIYIKEGFLQFEWITVFASEIKYNLVLLFSGNWIELTHLFRSLLFFILLGFMVYLLHYWLIQRKRIFVFFLLTAVYIAILDTFTPYDGRWAMIRTVIFGILLMGSLAYQRIFKKERLDFQAKTTRKWILSLLVMLTLSASIAYSLPKADPIWPDPISYIQVLSETGGEPGSKRVGYGVDDSQLGGSMTGDSSVVFRTRVESPHYWKVETKDVYTGKGWIQSQEELEPVEFLPENKVPITSILENGAVEKTEQTSYVRQVKQYPHVVYPFGVTTIQSEMNYRFELDPTIEKVYSFAGTQPLGINDYSVTFEKPSYSMTALEATTNVQDTNLSKAFLDQYTQLPQELPSRVKDLALELTTDEDTWYSKAKAIERYLKGPEFTYSLQDVAMPNGNKDYVDQFLFETMVGYCNNFSTSMIVLLRSLDIPARWVKGYTEGEYIGYVDGMYEYEVTNNNAHAWVEVYFPLVGWVTFDPTPGFSNVIDYYYNEEESVEEIAANVEMTQTENRDDSDEIAESGNLEESKNFSWPGFWDRMTTSFTNNVSWIYGFLLLSFIITIYLYRIRAKWLPVYYIRKFRHSEENECFVDAYQILLKQLHRAGFKRKAGQTLREYATEIDRHFATKEMTFLTGQYEKYLYGNRLENGTWDATRQLWENLIKKSAS